MNVNGFKIAGDDQVHKYRYPSLADIPNKNGSSIWTVEAENAHNGLIRISDLRGRVDLTPAKDDLVLDGNWNIYRIDLVGNSTVSATKFGNMGEIEDSDIFRVSYEVTTGDEIHEAVSAGKVCILLYAFPGEVYYLSWLGEMQNATPSGTVVEKSAIFTAIDGDEKTTIRVTGSTWFSPSTVKFARSASPTFTGTPKAPTAAAGTNTTQLATTAFVQQALASGDTGIFWATYNTTTEAEVTAAVTAGKPVLCKISDEVFYLVNKAAIGPSGSAWLFASANQTSTRVTWVSGSYWNSVGTRTIPTKASDLTNDSGFVNASGAAAAAPVQSVNGQTGAVTVQPATDAQVTTAVNTWLGNNIAQETGYALDASLTMSNAAAPADKVGELKSAVNYGKTINLISPIHKSGTFDGITYTFENGRIGLSGTKSGRILMQTITGNVGDKFSLSCLDISGGKPTFYVMNGSTIVSTYRQSDMNNTFTLPVETVTLEFYVSGTFSYDFALTLVKDEIPHFPLNLFADGDETTVNFADVTYEAIGDSLTYGFTGSWTEGVQNRIATPYPEKVKEILGMASAINKGETGTTIANDTDQMGTYYPISNDNRLNGYSYASVISVMGGTNDFTKGTALGTRYDSQTTNTFHAGWKRILSNLVGRFSPYNAFIFVIIPPVTQELYTDNSAGAKWIDYITATVEECRIFGIPVLDMSLMGRLCGANKATYTSDGIHFNQLYVSRIFAPMVADFIKRNIH